MELVQMARDAGAKKVRTWRCVCVKCTESDCVVLCFVVLWSVSWVDGSILCQYPRVCVCDFDRLIVSIFLTVCLSVCLYQ
jgi:hypothetical protein